VLKRLFHTTLITIVLTGLYSGYTLVISPFLQLNRHEGGQVIPTAIPSATGSARCVAVAEQYLPSHPWTAAARYQFRTKEAFIYTQNWESIEDGQSVRFQPFAFVWFPRGQKQEPIRVHSKSAVVKFSDRFSMSSPNPGRVIGSALNGEVVVRGPDGLNITGREFVFSEDALRAWSDHPVKFRYGPHSGEALRIELDFTKAEGADPDELAVSGIKRVQLRRNVIMDLVIDEDKLDGSAQTLHITSKGSFQYLLAERLARFEDEVHVTRPTHPGMYDSLQCDLLNLFFKPDGIADPAAEADTVAASSNEFESFESDLTFQKLKAEGSLVVLMSEENQLTAYMTALEFDQDSRTATLTHPDQVDVVQAHTRIRSPQIRFTQNEDGSIKSAACLGAGWLKHHDEKTGKLRLTALWKQQFLKATDPKSGWDFIELAKEAEIREPGQFSGLAGDNIRLYYQEIKSEHKTKQANRMLLTRPAAGAIQPKRLHANGHVVMVSPDLHGGTDELIVDFDERVSIDRQTDEHRQVAANDAAAGSSAAQSKSKNENAGSTLLPGSPLGSKHPLEVIARKIKVQVTQDPDADSPRVDELWCTDQVRVRHHQEKELTPLVITGSALNVKNRSSNDQLLTLDGTPAHIVDSRLQIEGKHIQLDRQKNTLLVKGRNLLRLPVKQSLDGEKLDQPQLLDIWSTEQLFFDGQTARFLGDVKVELDKNRMHCQLMTAQLSKRISFLNNDTPGTVDLTTIKCQEGVDFESTLYKNERLMEIRKGHFWEFDVHQLTGETVAKGPGQIQVWRRGQGKRAALTPAAVVQANAPLQSNVSDWEFMRINFVGRTEGNIQERHSTFHDRVEIIYGPVEGPRVKLDPDNLPKDAGWMRCRSLLFKQHEQQKNRPAFIELFAKGNAELEGRTFHARADTISFDESKELYMLRSLGSRKATIWRQTQLGGNMSRADAQRMEFVPSRNQLKLDRTTGLDGLQ